MLKSVIFGLNLLLSTTFLFINTSQANTQTAFDIEIKQTNGKTTTIDQLLQTAPVYIKFWATWCQDCLKQMPHFQHTHETYKNKLHVLSINIWMNDSLEDIANVVAKYQLSMPMGVDYTGELKKAFNFVGTPYHLLIDQNRNIVHAGYKSDDRLDQKVAFIATGKLESKHQIALHEEKPGTLDREINRLIHNDTPTALLFVTTWCESYLKNSRPKQSKNCVDMQAWANKLQHEQPQITWQTVVSRLWTGDSELAQYKTRHQLKMPASIDPSNTVFERFKVQDFPTLILFNDGKEITRATKMNSYNELLKEIKNYPVLRKH
ncbi:MAG: hypothetical protein COA42_14410 [Alteromonadaceae bacterium]|nr:MAG: hypothetical protein COA42_14410 [Alteromonadaceae bacterium]